MLPISAQAITEISPDSSGAVYHVKTPDVFERADFRRSMIQRGAVFHSDDAVLDCLSNAVLHVVHPDTQAELIDLIQLWRDSDRSDFDLSQKIQSIESVVGREWQPYLSMVADRSHYMDIAPIVAFQTFVVGWSGIDISYRRVGSTIPVEVLGMIQPQHLVQVGIRALGLMNLTKAQEKN